MKKTYIAPMVELEEMNGEDELLSTSPSLPIDDTGYTITDDAGLGAKPHTNSPWCDDDE